MGGWPLMPRAYPQEFHKGAALIACLVRLACSLIAKCLGGLRMTQVHRGRFPDIDDCRTSQTKLWDSGEEKASSNRVIGSFRE